MKGVCKVCGCTLLNPCFHPTQGFCWWATDDQDICSHCADELLKNDQNTIHCVHGMEFPVLTIHQPYALMIVKGLKKIEYRNWRLPEKYVGKRIFIHASKTMADFNRHYADKEIFNKCMNEAYDKEQFGMILGSVLFGKSQGPFNGIMYGAPCDMYEWPVTDPIQLNDPLRSIIGKQRIWKIKF